MKQRADDNHYIPVWKLLTRRKATARSLCHHLGVTAGRPSDVPTIFMGPARASCGDLAGSLRLFARVYDYFGPKQKSKIVRCPHDYRVVPVLGSYDVTVMCLRAYDFFRFAELNKIEEATMPVNPYDDRKVSLRRPHGNGDLDIVRASYTCRKANVTEALMTNGSLMKVESIAECSKGSILQYF